jgi:hypothetical protein
MTLDIGIASYKSAEKLQRTVDSIAANTVQPYRLMVWHNHTEGDDDVLRVLERLKCERVVHDNVGYAGAVNGLLARSTAPYFLYCDNDIEVRTRGWDQMLMEVLEQNPECAQVFPGAGHYGFNNGKYFECLWNAGYCWMLRTSTLDAFRLYGRCNSISEGNPLDISLGHHEEVDLMIRLRLAGFTIGCRPDVNVFHHETATSSPDSEKRIRAGVIRWMNKWNRYFCGDILKYPDPDDPASAYDPRALRYTDWPPCALYLERWTLAQFPDWNKYDRASTNWKGGQGFHEVKTTAGEMDAVEILKPKGCYRGRAI